MFQKMYYWVRHLTFFFQLVLISCLIWQIISFILPPNEYGCVYTWTMLESGPAIDLQKMPILAKRIIFSYETHFDLGGYVNKQNYRIWGTENPHAYIERRRTQNESLFGADFGHFSSKMSKERPLQSIAIVIGPCWMNFCSRKLKRRILATSGFNRTALCALQPKLHSMFSAPFLKNALLAAKLTSFGHLGVRFDCHKISVTPISQRQLTL